MDVILKSYSTPQNVFEIDGKGGIRTFMREAVGMNVLAAYTSQILIHN
jgi:hypothetical protein